MPVLSEHCKTLALLAVFKMTLEAASFIKESTTEQGGRSITLLRLLLWFLWPINYPAQIQPQGLGVSGVSEHCKTVALRAVFKMTLDAA